MKNIKEKVFTLIELLVVIAIISILASILFVAIDPAGQSRKANDAKRIVFMNQLEKALELYALDHNGSYPPITAHTSGTGYNKAVFNNMLKDYIAIDITADYLDLDADFYYRSVSLNQYKTYGSMITMHSSSSTLKETDGGWYGTAYEIGADPRYCKNLGISWWNGCR